MLHLMQIGQTVTGRVKHVTYTESEQMNYGFITPDDASLNDLFVHHSEIEPWRDGFKDLKVGDCVKFKISKGSGRNSGKWQAVNVEIDRDARKSRRRQGAFHRHDDEDNRGNR